MTQLEQSELSSSVLQPQQQQPVEEQFIPKYNRDQTRNLISTYDKNPAAYSQYLEDIRAHAQYHNLPFYEGDFSIIEALKQAGGGFVEGFTTLKISDPPDNEYEAIFRNIGHLAGFAPGIIAGPAKALKLTGLAKAASAIGEYSVPMFGAKYLTKGAKTIVGKALKSSRNSRFGAMDTASNFLLGERAKHVAEGAFHLGSASAISSVWDGVDMMVESFFGGAVAGGVFRGIGNLVNIKGDPQAEKFVRGLAGSLFMGIPATQRGATTPEQIYEYLLGAYFGGKEMPWFKAKAAKAIQKMDKQARKDPKMEVERDPELLEKWEEYPEIVQKEIKKQASKIWGDSDTRTGMMHGLMEELGILEQIPAKEIADKGIDAGYPILSKVLKSGVTPTNKKLMGTMGISGGASGSDSYFAHILEKAGIPVVHYLAPEKVGDFTNRYVKGRGHKVLPFGTKLLSSVPREMSERELLNNIPEVERASLNLNKSFPTKSKNLILRNSEIIKKSSKIYAIGEIYRSDTIDRHAKENPQLHGKAVKGGTGWGVQMAIDAKKPVFVFDQAKNSWFTYNYKAGGGGRFVPLKGTPDLVQRPGLIGTQKLSKGGKDAIKELVEKAFPGTLPKVKPRTDSKIPGAVTEKETRVSQKTLEQIFKLHEKMGDLDVSISERKDVLKEGKVDKVRQKELKKEIKELEKESKDLERMIDFRLKLRENEFVNERTDKVETEDTMSVDTGMPLTAVGVNSMMFTEQHLKPFWDVGINFNTKRKLKEMRAKQIHEFMVQHIDRGSKRTRIDDLVKAIENEFDPINLSREAKGQLKQWLRKNNMGQNVRFVRTIGNKISLSNRLNPQSYSGKRKEVVQPPSILETAYKEVFSGKEKKGATEDVVVIWDEITVENNKMLNDIPIYRYLKHLTNLRDSNGKKVYNKKEAKEAYNKKFAKMINFMYKKHDMVPFGGSGDKARIVFVKLHPDVRSNVRKKDYIDKKITEVLKQLKTVDKHAKSLYDKSKADYKKRFGKGMGEQFDRTFLSNVLYDMILNGYATGPLEFNKSLKNIIGSGFIPNAVNYNKRAQIWLNSFFTGDKAFFQGQGLGMTNDGNFRYILAGDPRKPKGLTSLEALNIELPEHVDGAILVRSDVIKRMLEDAGLPESGQNKSFIISRGHKDNMGNPLGTLLGKYMMHDAGPVAEAQMKKAGVHMIVMTSAAKQIGKREVGDYEVAKDGTLSFTKGTVPYELNPDDVYYSPSTFGQKHMLKPQIWVKQLFTNLHQYGHSNIKPEVIEDMFDSVIGEKIRGTEEGNALLEGYLKDFDTSKLNKIFKNLDNIGTNDIIKASKTPGAEIFAKRLFARMLDANVELISEMVRDGEMSVGHAESVKDDMMDFASSSARLLDIAEVISQTKAEKTGLPIYFHKYIRDYRNQVIHNWVSNQVTRPKMDNSGVGFIRPFDKWMQVGKNTKELNKRDDIFFLDKSYEDMDINLAFPVKGSTRMKLGELWKTYNEQDLSKGMKEYLEDVFESVVLRVPMDSMSGAHKLKFKGFTDRNGHGIMLHSRTMRAIGGADLDGDESFFYFGGRLETGEGSGMKKSWKEAIHAQKEEFYNFPEKVVPTRKNEKDAQDIVSNPNNIKLFKKHLSNMEKEGIPMVRQVGQIDFSNVNKAVDQVAEILKIYSTPSYWRLARPDDDPSMIVEKPNIVTNTSLAKGNFKNYFYRGPQPDVGDNKKSPVVRPDGLYSNKTFADLLAEQGANDLKTSKTLYYSPEARLKASEGAVQGRDMLGVSSNQTQILKAAYSLIMDSPNKSDEFTIRKWNPQTKKSETLRITVKPREGEGWGRYQREMTRAQIAFPSDPLDEAGLKDANTFFKLLHDAYFTIKVDKFQVTDKKKKTGKWVPSKIKMGDLGGYELKGGVYSQLYDMNRANFSRDFANNRNWTYEERAEMNDAFFNFPPEQLNVMLPKMAGALANINYSDHIYKRLDPKEIEKMYTKMEEYVKDLDKEFSYKDLEGNILPTPGPYGNWLRDAMERSSFRVKYNDDVNVIFKNHGASEKNPRYLFEEDIIQSFAWAKGDAGRKRFLKAIEGTTWAKRLNDPSEKWRLKNPREKVKILREVVRNAEDFLINDFINMTSVINTVELVKKHNIPAAKVMDLHKKAEVIKNNSYMSMKARQKLKFVEDAEGDISIKQQQKLDLLNRILKFGAGKKLALPDKKKLLGEKVSAFMDQLKIDDMIKEIKYGTEAKNYKDALSKPEQELFDHFLIGSLNRGDYDKLQKIYNAMPSNMKDPLTEDLYRKIMKEGANTNLSRVGFNSPQVSNRAIRHHLEKLSELFGEAWRGPSKEQLRASEKIVEGAEKNEMTLADGTKEPGYLGTKYEIDNLVEKGLSGEGFAGITKKEITPENKKMIVELAGYLKEQNDYLGRNLNEMLRGITGELYDKPKDLNAFHKQDFINVLNFFRDVKTGTMFQRLWGDTSPEMKARYYHMFPEAVNRELMRYDIDWLKQEGYFVTKDGSVSEKPGKILKPTYFIDVLMNQINKTGGLSVSKAEQLITENAKDFLFLEELKDGKDLFSFSVLDREYKMTGLIDAQKDTPDGTKAYWKQSYAKAFREKWKEIDWDNRKNKKYTVTNDVGDRVTITGYEVVNGNSKKEFTGIKRRLNKRFGKLHRFISGDREWMIQRGYISATTYGKGQLKVNWKKFVEDVYELYRRGNEDDMSNLMENVGVDGMRHISRAMLIDLVKGKENKDKIVKWPISDTGRIPFEMYWPHMFFNKKDASNNMQSAIKMINNDPLMTPKEKEAEIERIVYRHKALTGDWEFQDMQIWDRVDRLSVSETLKAIDKAKSEKMDKLSWYDANQKIGSMNSRTGHIPGWSTDITVMDAYMRNISNTFFKHLQQVMARDTINRAEKQMDKKFGKELSARWKRFFELYVQGAIGNPEIIPEQIYNDPNMKIKGTPYSWWADNRIRDRVNSIADKLGVNKKDLPKELQKFGYRDIRDWSNMEAKWELASLLAHPKSSVTNIFGGSLHTIENAGFSAFKKGRDIKFLKRINPEWNTLKDVEKWVIEKGVLPEFLVHELGLDKQFKDKNISDFVSDLSSAFQAKDKVKRSELRNIASKHGISEKATNFAAKFMSVPERTLRRDAFMAHYVRAWESFGGAIRDPNHPFLIEMAKKGVKATQFLYNAPNRPMFARSALGKVMSRFQLFAWNSVRLRNEILRQAKIQGFKPGAARDRFVRMMQMDLMVLALANMFMYSLFDNALPPPWNWFQDTADWLFGDEKERDKAFFGELPTPIAPLKVIMPPASRVPVTALSQWIRDDYSKFTDMTIWTMFPFGRISRDLFHPEQGLVNNPSRFMEKVAGMPLQDLTRKISKQKKEKEEGTFYTTPKPGVKFGY